jgi:hypothetical protein
MAGACRRDNLELAAELSAVLERRHVVGDLELVNEPPVES